MGNKVREFLNEVFGEVRAFEENGQIWFIASDIAKVLEFSNSRMMTSKLDDEEKGVRSCDTLGGNQEMTVVNESGLYSIVLGVTKKDMNRYEKAKEFKRWICGTVIPSLRKDGAYIDGEENITSGEMSEDEFILKAMTILQNKVERLTKERDELKGENDKFMNTENALGWDTVAKNLQIGKNIMLKKLRELKILQTDTYEHNGRTCNGESHNVPYQQFAKYFEVKYVIKGDKRFPKVLVTAKGQEYIYKKLKEEGLVS